MKIIKKINFKRKFTINNIIDSFLLYKKPKIKNSTYYRYQYVLNKYIVPEFGNYTIAMLKNYDFNIFVDKLSESLSCKTIQDIIVILKSLLKFIETRFDCHFNLNLITLPKASGKEMFILSDAEQEIILKECTANYTSKNVGLIICLNTGIRLGEICALKWKDIDLENSIINIDKTVQRIYIGKENTKMLIDVPKSQKSKRKIPIPNKVKQLLLKLNNEYEFSDDEYFLTHSKTKFIEPRSYEKYFAYRLRKWNIPRYNFHILRHTFATNCVKIGMDTKSLSELLGHSSVEITLNKYVHSSFEQKIKYLEML